MNLIMKLIKIFHLALLTLFISFAHADDIKIRYHCPETTDITFNRHGSFQAITDYNGIHVEWYSTRLFYRPNQNNLQFDSARSSSDCSGDTCEIRCIYRLEPNNYFDLSVRYQQYRFLDPASSSWQDRVCRAASSTQCEFYMIKDSWW